ncbi:MAG: helix-turn-helix domain-containing protein [Myxococcales bacterium]|nr:helix-turn-helix domain-containing protein [Myxococcales bacterium]
MTTLHKTRAPVDPAAPTMVVQMTVEALRELVREVQAEVLADHGPAQPAPALLDRAGLARALSVSVSSVDRMIREGCPHVRIGDAPRFSVADVVAWLRARQAGGPIRAIDGGRR